MASSDRDGIAMRPVFIVGPPRSGTTWVQRLLLSDPHVCGGQETHFFNVFSEVVRSFHAHQKLGRNVGLPSYWDQQSLLDEIRAIWLKTVSPVIDNRPDAKLLVEKTPDHATVIPEILEFLPEAKFVHVIRDSRAVVASLLAAGQGWGSAWAPRNAGSAAILWHRYTCRAMEARQKMPAGRFLAVRYEDLLNDSLRETRRLFDFIGIEKTPDDLNALVKSQEFSQQQNQQSPINVVRGNCQEPPGFLRHGKTDSWKRELSLAQKLTVWRYTRKLMHNLGYNWRGAVDRVSMAES